MASAPSPATFKPPRRPWTQTLTVGSLCLFAALCATAWAKVNHKPQALQTGDLIFHTSKSKLSAMIASTTRSPYTHVGVVVIRRGKPWVMEAGGRVRWTALNRFKTRGAMGRYRVRRLKGGLNSAQKRKLKRVLGRYLGRPYDIKFRWGERRIYCSELPWLAYKRGLGITLAKPQRKGELFQTYNPLLRAYLARYFRRNGPDLEELIISPARLFQSESLRDVAQ